MQVCFYRGVEMSTFGIKIEHVNPRLYNGIYCVIPGVEMAYLCFRSLLYVECNTLLSISFACIVPFPAELYH